MNNFMKRSICVLLALLMLLTVAPVAVFADGETTCQHDKSEAEVVDPIDATCTTKGREGGLKCPDCGKIFWGGEEKPALGHSFTVLVKTEAATCTSGGYTEYKCVRCNETEKRDQSSALSHNFVFDKKVDPTCEADGYTLYKCANAGCTATEQRDKKNKTGHNYVEISSKPATCEEDGSKTSTCTRCNDTKTEKIAKLDHKYVIEKTEATCETGGSTRHICSVCGDNYTDNVSPALGHNFSEWKVVTNASCGVAEVKERECSRCHKKETKTGEATEHKYVKTVFEPSCTEMGYTQYKCSICGDEKQEDVKPALGHDIVEDELVEPDCRAPGKTERRYCKRCNMVLLESVELPKTDHDIDVSPMKAPTCTAEGFTEGKQCRYCGEVFEEVKPIPAKGHNYEEIVITPATCITDGVSTFTCKDCQETHTDTVPAKGHSYLTEWTIDKPETCTEAGEKSHHCTVCDARADITEINALGGNHKWGEEWIIDKPSTCTDSGLKSHHCTVCGEKEDVTSVPPAHKYVKTTTPATMSKDGLIEEKCSKCGDVKSSTVIYKIKTVALSKTSYLCDGNEKKPSVSVVNSQGTTLVRGTDFTVTYDSGRKNVGTYNVVFKFQGKYSGEKTLKYTINPKAPMNLGYTATLTSITLTWDKVVGAAKYEVYMLNAKTKKYEKKATVTSPKATIKSLALNTKYTFKVLAYDSSAKFKSNYSNEYTAKTNAFKAPTGLKATKTISSVTLTWNKVTDAAKYEVHMYNAKTKKYEKKATVSTNKATIKSLTPSTSYKFKVLAIDSTGKYKTGFSSVVTVKTNALKAPTNLKATQTTTSITLSWTKASDAAKYEVHMYNAKTKKYEKKATVSAAKATISKLTAGTTYKFKVLSIDKSGKVKSGFSSVLTTATKCVAPSVTVTSPARRTVRLSWKKVSGATSYTLYYSRTKDGTYTKFGTTSSTIFTDNTFTSGRTYYFKVVANKKVTDKLTVSSANSAVKTLKVR